MNCRSCCLSKPPTPEHVPVSPPLTQESCGEQGLLPALGNVPGEQRAQAVTFTLLQFEGLVVLRNGPADGTPGGVVTPGGDTEVLADAAIGPVDAGEGAVLPEVRTVTSVVAGRV